MKKIGFAFLFFVNVISFGFSLDAKYDFSKIDLQKVIDNKQNKLIDGNVVETNYFYNYGSRINYSITCKRNNLDDSYIFFSSDDADSLYDFFVEYLNDYINRSFKITLDSNFYKSEVEYNYNLTFKEGYTYSIYTKYHKSKGFRGFGVTIVEPYEHSSRIQDVATYYENYSKCSYLEDYNIDPEDLEPGIVYYHNIEIPASAKISFKEIQPLNFNEFNLVISAMLVKRTSNRFTMKLVCDESLKNDENFLNMVITSNYQNPRTFRDLLEENHNIFFGDDIARFRIDAYLSDEQFANYKDKFYILIE